MNSLLISHISVAIASMIYTAYIFTSPTRAKLYIAYALAGTALASGFYLVFKTPDHRAQACVTGLAYFAVVGYGIYAARKKLVTE